jgi:hypothetical protein
MSIDVQRRVLDDGTEVIRRCDDNLFVSERRVLKLASGKTVMSQHDEAGRLTSETYSHGVLRIGLQRDYEPSGTVTEMFFVNRKLVSRARYEKERAAFPDMPAPDVSNVDFGAGLLAEVSAERRARRKARAIQDPSRGQRLDAFCAELMAKSYCVELIAAANIPPFRLGEKTARASQTFLATLRRQGAVAVWACVAPNEGDDDACDDLVVELPADPSSRKAMMRTAARAANEQGFDAYADDGQRFVYLKMS